MIMKIKIIKTTMLSIMLAGLLIIGCTSNEDAAPTESKITKEQYETMFKKQLLDNINNKEIAPNSVSYTHLDVYKRQVQKSSISNDYKKVKRASTFSASGIRSSTSRKNNSCEAGS